MTDVAELLDELVPPYHGTGDWGRVLRDAGLARRPRRRPYRLAAVVALVAAIAGVVAFWPAGGTVDRYSTARWPRLETDRCFTSSSKASFPGTLVDLQTGERTELRSQHEVWFDPEPACGRPRPSTESSSSTPHWARTRSRSTRPLSTPVWASATGRRSSPGRPRSSGRTQSTEPLSIGSESGTVTTSPCPATPSRVRPRHPERSAGLDPHRHLRDRRSRLGAARGRAAGRRPCERRRGLRERRSASPRRKRSSARSPSGPDRACTDSRSTPFRSSACPGWTARFRA